MSCPLSVWSDALFIYINVYTSNIPEYIALSRTIIIVYVSAGKDETSMARDVSSETSVKEDATILPLEPMTAT